MSKLVKSAPKHIWLNVSDERASHDESFPGNHEDISWNAGDSPCFVEAVQYTRSDVLAGQSWQPIETAPKDGSLILTWGDCRAQWAVSYWDDGDEDWYTDYREKGGIQSVYATHWMPLPEPPVAEVER